MLLEIPAVLDDARVRHFQQALADAPWADGKLTAGYQSALAKHNQQLPETLPLAQALGAEIVNALDQNLLFQAAALPKRIFPPLFNRYEGGQHFGTHIDNSIRTIATSGERLRTDLSATLFLADPASYDGGELVIEDRFGVKAVKLAAGHLILYPASSLHQVRPVRRGARVAAFFWIQSLVRDAGQRSILFDLDLNLQRLRGELGDAHSALVALSGCYHNLLRSWAEL